MIFIKGLILAGGHGTRLRPLTHTISKQLIPIANKPMLFYCIEALVDAGIKDIGVIVGHTPQRIQEIKDTVGDGSKWGANITYIEQDIPKGIAHAIGLAENFVGNEPFVTVLGDNLLKDGIKEYIEGFEKSNSDFEILLAKHNDPSRFGVAIFNKDKLVGLVEKPKNPPSRWVITGVYMLRPPVFEVIKKLKPSWRNELEITEAADIMVKSKKYKVTSKKVNGWWKDTGKPEDILEVNHLVLDDLEPYNKGSIDENATIIGKVAIGEGSVIGGGCVIRGPVIIGKNCDIGPDTYIGPYTSIGNNTIIKNAEIESSIIIGECKIDCNKRIIDSLIGENVTITSAEGTKPKACKLVLGENSFISI